MLNDDFFKNEDLSEKKDENSFFHLLFNEQFFLKNVFILSEILNIKKFENE